MRRYGCSESTSQRRAARRGARRARTARARRARRVGDSRIASSRIASIGTVLPRRDDSLLRDHDLRLARLQALRDGGRGEAGEDRHLDRADVRASRARRRRPRATSAGRCATRSPGSTPSETSCLGEPRHVARELGERQLAARRRPRRARRRRCRPAGRSAQRCTQLCAIVHRRADEPGRPRGPARVVEHLRPGLGELEPHVLDRERPEPGRILLPSGARARAKSATPARRTRRVAFACSTVARSGRQTTSLTAAIQSPTTPCRTDASGCDVHFARRHRTGCQPSRMTYRDCATAATGRGLAGCPAAGR